MQTLDVMVLESAPHAADEAVRQLESAGHHVHRCHEPDAAPFPCNALRDGHSCPLARGVDVALIVNANAEPEPTAFEEGIGCAVRAHVPLVEDGDVLPSPYAPWLTARANGDLVAAVQRGAQAGQQAMRDAIIGRIAPALADGGIAADDLQISFAREGRDMAVSVVGPIPPDLTSRLAVRVADAIRDADRHYDRLRIAVGTP